MASLEEQERELERRQSRLTPKKKSLAEQERELEAKQTRLTPRYKTRVDASLEVPTTVYSAPRSTTLKSVAPVKPQTPSKPTSQNVLIKALSYLGRTPDSKVGRTPLPANRFGGAMSVPVPTKLKPFLGDSIDPTIGTLMEVTGIPYLARELSKIPNIKDLKDASWKDITLDYGRGAVAVSPPLLGFTIASDIKGQSKINLSPTKTDAERKSLPFGDILFRSKETMEYLENKPITDTSAQTVVSRIGAGFRPIDALLTGMIAGSIIKGVGKVSAKTVARPLVLKAQEKKGVKEAEAYLKKYQDLKEEVAKDKLTIAIANKNPDTPNVSGIKMKDEHFEFLAIKENRDAVDDLVKQRLKETDLDPRFQDSLRLGLSEEDWLKSFAPTDYSRLKFGKENLDPKDVAFYNKKEKELAKNIEDTKKYEVTKQEVYDYEKTPDFIKRQEKKRLAEEKSLAKEKADAVKEAESFDKADFLEKDRLKAKETQDYIKAQKELNELIETQKKAKAKREASRKKDETDTAKQNRIKKLEEADAKERAEAENLAKKKKDDYETYLLKQLAEAQKNKNPVALAYWKKRLDEEKAIEKTDDFLTKVEKNIEDDGKFGGENKIGTRPDKDPLPKRDTGDKGTEVKFDESKSSAPTKEKPPATGESKDVSFYTKKIDDKTYNELLADPTALKVKDIVKQAFTSASEYYGTTTSKEDFKAWQSPDGKLGISYESGDSPSFEVILATGNELTLVPLPKVTTDPKNPYNPWVEIAKPKETEVVVPKTTTDKKTKKAKSPQRKDTSIKIPDEVAVSSGKVVGDKIVVEIPKRSRMSALITTDTPDVTRSRVKIREEEKIEDPERAKTKSPKEEPEKMKVEEGKPTDDKKKGKVIKDEGKSKPKVRLPNRKKIKDIKLEKPNQYGYLFTWQQGNQYPVANLLTNKVKYTRVRPRNLPMGNTVAETFTVLKSSNVKPQVRRLDIGKFFANISRGGVQFELKRKIRNNNNIRNRR
tara:strand:- start:3897 stop:6875 length:2979 start_codon:yes stop_codon:yes gene_type:complete